MFCMGTVLSMGMHPVKHFWIFPARVAGIDTAVSVSLQCTASITWGSVRLQKELALTEGTPMEACMTRRTPMRKCITGSSLTQGQASPCTLCMISAKVLVGCLTLYITLAKNY
jgi:hypothetical protein